MSNTSKLRLGPGVRSLEEPLKSIAEFENWKHSVLYNLRLDGEFKNYLAPSFIFGPKTKVKPFRNLQPDAGEHGKTAETKCSDVDFMLEQIAQYCPKIPHNDIIRDCGSLEDVWQVVRLHSNIETSGTLLNDCWNIVRLPNETPQALYSRLKQAYDDNLIRKSTLKYKHEVLDEDEELSPTLHCTVILHWLQILHPKLRDLVSQRFCTELRNSTYAAIWPEISRSVDSLLRELSEDASVCRYSDRYSDTPRYSDTSSRPSMRSRGSYSRPRGTSQYRSAQSTRQCDYCRILGKRAYYTHVIDDCLFLKKERQSSMQGASNAVEAEEYDDHYNEFYEENPTNESRQIVTEHLISPTNANYKKVTEHRICRIAIHASPVITMYHSNKPYNLTLDTGGTCNALDKRTAEDLHCEIHHTFQTARMADGETMLEVLGETDIDFTRNGKSFRLSALVCNISEPTILAGMPFLFDNDIAIRPAKAEIIIDGILTIKYNPQKTTKALSCRLSSYTVRSPSSDIILPGQAVSFPLPAYLSSQKTVAVEPRHDNSHNRLAASVWPIPMVHEVSEGILSITNTSKDPVVVKKNEHICNIQSPVSELEMPPVSSYSVQQVSALTKSSQYSSPVQVNPDGVLSSENSTSYITLLQQYDEVFNPAISKYNGKSGACYVEVNMGPNPPPQHKGRIPFYGRNNLIELQTKFDTLASKGVFKRPQDIGVTVENINPSFLVKKKSSSDKRLVTDFGSIASYCRPTPTLMPDVDSTLRQIAAWKFIIKTDLTEAYFQIPLKKSSMKYCGVVSPMKGVLVYTVGCMGLPGTEVALEELTCLLFGHMVMQGKVAKLADDLFIGADTPQELFKNFEEVLSILLENNLRLSAKKTIVAPKSVMVLGWIWSNGFLTASPHRLSALSECSPPSTISALKSYIGAYRFLSRVIKDYASLLLTLEGMISGKSSGNVKLEWSTEQLQAFHAAQSALKQAKAIALPRSSDVLHIVTDAAAQPTAIGATLYVIREGKTLLGGFFNAKLPPFQRRWLPCELEGVSIGAALSHYAPYLLQSQHKPIVLTDSKACVQAVEKLNRGEYSASARLCSFLSTVSRYQAVVQHIQGTANVTSDFISRHPVTCDNPRCQVCKFLTDSMSSVVAAVSVSDVLEGKVHLPFINKKSWIEIQDECPDLRHVFKFLRNGTTPGKKGKNLRQVKRYITSKVIISTTGALVVRHIEPFQPVTERIVVPQQVLHGVLTVLHIKLNHPSSLQLTKVFSRFFFALNLEKAVTHTSSTCHQCSSLKEIPKSLKKETSEDPPDHIAQKFAADVIKRNKQLILVLRECVSSYTQAELILNETAPEIAAGLHRLSNIMRPSTLSQMIIRLDAHPSHRSLFDKASEDKVLSANNIKLDIGHELNINHNPVAEKAIRELIKEILILTPEGGPISSTTLSQAVASLNSRLRAPGVSAHEVFTQRDQTSGSQLTLDDLHIIQDQHRRRTANHHSSELCKSGGKPPHPDADIHVGSLVYLYQDGSKLNARPRYVVLSVEEGFCKLRRFAQKLLGSRTYKVRLSDCYVVPEEVSSNLPPYPVPEIESNDEVVIDDKVNSSDQHSHQPQQESDSEYPCTICHQEVGDEDHALLCDSCSDWCHRACCGMEEEEYETLIAEEEFDWVCPSCPVLPVAEEDEVEEDPPDRT